MTIDSHVHFWKYDKTVYPWIDDRMRSLKEDFFPEHIAPTLKRNDVDGVVAIQADQREVETRFLVEMSHTHPLIKGVVGWVDLRSERVSERLDHFAEYPIIKGWRHIVQDETDDFLLDKDFQRGVALLASRNYTYDILIYPRQLKNAIEFARTFPDQRFVLDHCAKPGIQSGDIDQWRTDIKTLATMPNVYCKLSGLITEAKWKNWSPADFYPVLDTVFEAFGTDRLMFGSDWPVMLLSGMYVQWKSLIEKYMQDLTQDEKDNVMALNAQQFYQL